MGDTRQWRADEHGRPERDAGPYADGYSSYPSDWAGDWNRAGDQRWNRGWGSDERPGPRRERGGAHRAVLMSSVVAAGIVALGLVGAVAYVISPGTGTTQVAAPVAPSAAPAPAAISSPAAAAPTTETVTVRATAPEVQVSDGYVTGGDFIGAHEPGPYPTGADSSGWTGDSDARCNAGDPATIIGRTASAMFSICTNPANGRYYYRGSSGGAGIEIDDPSVSQGTAVVVNGDYVYRTTYGQFVISRNGGLVSAETMID